MTPANGERRLAAIVVADVVGYSRLMGANEEGTIDALQALHAAVIDPLIARNSGHLFKSTGDGFLVEFPSVVAALRCSIEIQKSMAKQGPLFPTGDRARFRIGINLGDVILRDGDVFGDGVNIAARLENLARPGGICISADVYRHVAGKINANFVNGGRQRLKNIADPVEVYHVSIDEASPTLLADISAVRTRWSSGLRLPAAALLALILVASIAWLLIVRAPSREDAAALSENDAVRALPIVAVLPFENQTGDAKEDYFANGFTDELIGALGRFNSIRVIASNAVRAYRKRNASVSAISAELGAAYLVEGSVRKSAEHLRLSARLTHAQKATVLWSQRFDGKIADIFDFQDSISRQIAGTLAASIVHLEAEKSARRPVPQQGAHDLVLQARASDAATSRSENRRIRNLLAKAIELDPNYASARSLLSEAIYARIALGWTEFPTREAQQAEALAKKAIELAPNEPDGYRALGRLHLLLSEYDRAQPELQRAIEINPSDSRALAAWGAARLFTGQAKSAAEVLALALKYDPAIGPIYLNDLALAYYFEGKYELALQTASRGLSQYPDFPNLHIVAAASAGRLGRQELAGQHAQEVHKRIPFLTLKDVGSRFKDVHQVRQLQEGLSMAGF